MMEWVFVIIVEGLRMLYGSGMKTVVGEWSMEGCSQNEGKGSQDKDELFHDVWK